MPVLHQRPQHQAAQAQPAGVPADHPAPLALLVVPGAAPAVPEAPAQRKTSQSFMEWQVG